MHFVGGREEIPSKADQHSVIVTSLPEPELSSPLTLPALNTIGFGYDDTLTWRNIPLLCIVFISINLSLDYNQSTIRDTIILFLVTWPWQHQQLSLIVTDVSYFFLLSNCIVSNASHPKYLIEILTVNFVFLLQKSNQENCLEFVVVHLYNLSHKFDIF